MTEIDVTFQINSENTNCPICYSIVTTPLLQCHNALHFVCLLCFKKCRRKGYCPQCQTSRIFHNKFLERTIRHQTRVCTNEGCKVSLFPWDEEHENHCRFKLSKCRFCDDNVSKASIKEHIKEEWQVPWVTEGEPNNGSSSLTEYCRNSRKGFHIEMDAMTKSFVALRNDQVIIFERCENDYKIELFQLNEDSANTDIIYWMPNESKCFDKYTTISMKPNNSGELRPTIPIEAIDVLIFPRTNSEEREQNGVDRFFEQLLDPRVIDADDD